MGVTDVRCDSMVLESPIVRTCPSEARLHFICDAETSGLSNVLVHLLQIVVGIHNRPTDTLNRFGDEPSQLA